MKLQFGEYVSLGKVESELKTCPLVENICVYGDATKNFTVALIVPNHRHLEEIAESRGITDMSFEELCNNSKVEKAVLQALVEHSKKCTYYSLNFDMTFESKSNSNCDFCFLHYQAIYKSLKYQGL